MNFDPIAYLDWAKQSPKPSINLTRSGMPGLALSDLDIDWRELFLDGAHGHGYPPLVEAVAQRYGVETEQVTTAPGASMSLFMICAALLEEGDEALVEKPAYEPLTAVPGALRAGIRRFERRFEDGFGLNVENILRGLTRATRLILLTDLHNPSGIHAGRTELRVLAEKAEERGIWLVVDEVYLEFLPPGLVGTAFGLAPNVVTLSSLTKVFGLGGLRRGWILAPRGLTRKLLELRNYLFNEEVFIEEQISARVFPHLDDLRSRTRPLIERNREMMRRFVEGEKKLSWVEPTAGIVCFPRLHGVSGRNLDYVLRESYDTAIVPGEFFEGPEHVRIGFGVAEDVLQRGLENIRSALSYL